MYVKSDRCRRSISVIVKVQEVESSFYVIAGASIVLYAGKKPAYGAAEAESSFYVTAGGSIMLDAGKKPDIMSTATPK